MIAMLGMYDMPPLHDANDRLWQAIRSHLGYGPPHLDREAKAWDVWQSPDLVLAQTCGMPFRTCLHDKVTLVGTPDYALPECPPGYYRSVLVVGADAPGTTVADFAGGTFAYNEPLSQSGWAAPMTHLNAASVRFKALLRTGAHAASARAVADGHADIAGIDALTWALLCEHDDAPARLRVIAQTTPTPGLPFITAQGHDPAPIASAVRAAIQALSAQDRALLHLQGLVAIPPEAYMAIANPPAPWA
jgi:ABC-type phosphate/phosphonate transport system substrate-binding protein